MTTYYHSRIAKQDAFNARCAKSLDAAAKIAREDAILAANPHIGLLIRKGSRVFYTNAPTYCESKNIEELA